MLGFGCGIFIARSTRFERSRSKYRSAYIDFANSPARGDHTVGAVLPDRAGAHAHIWHRAQVRRCARGLLKPRRVFYHRLVWHFIRIYRGSADIANTSKATIAVWQRRKDHVARNDVLHGSRLLPHIQYTHDRNFYDDRSIFFKYVRR